MNQRNRDQSGPGEPLAKGEAALARRGEPKLETGGSELDRIPVSQEDRFGYGLRIYGGQSFAMCLEEEPLFSLESNFEVLIPNAGIIKLNVAIGGTTDPYRKTAGDP